MIQYVNQQNKQPRVNPWFVFCLGMPTQPVPGWGATRVMAPKGGNRVSPPLESPITQGNSGKCRGLRCANKFMKHFLLLIIFFCVMSIFAADRYPFTSVQQANQFNTLTQQLRCLVCQNESIADSGAGLADDLREQVYLQIKMGKSNQDITQYLVARYGDFVRFDPPIDSRTYVLWYAPFVLLLIGFLILFFSIKRRQS